MQPFGQDHRAAQLAFRALQLFVSGGGVGRSGGRDGDVLEGGWGRVGEWRWGEAGGVAGGVAGMCGWFVVSVVRWLVCSSVGGVVRWSVDWVGASVCSSHPCGMHFGRLHRLLPHMPTCTGAQVSCSTLFIHGESDGRFAHTHTRGVFTLSAQSRRTGCTDFRGRMAWVGGWGLHRYSSMRKRFARKHGGGAECFLLSSSVDDRAVAKGFASEGVFAIISFAPRLSDLTVDGEIERLQCAQLQLASPQFALRQVRVNRSYCGRPGPILAIWASNSPRSGRGWRSWGDVERFRGGGWLPFRCRPLPDEFW